MRYAIGGHAVFSDFNLTIEAGESVVLLGESGSGKTTALRMVNALLFPDAGDVLVEGKPTREWDLIRLRRRIGYVIQEGGLFPHWTVARNIATVPRLEGWEEQRITKRVAELLEAAGLPGYGNRYPRELSGGQRQRVGVARALAAEPDLLLFDEPFAALDPTHRSAAQRQFLAAKRTSLFVTHHLHEALRVGSRIVCLKEGKLAMDRPVATVLTDPDPVLAPFLEAERPW